MVELEGGSWRVGVGANSRERDWPELDRVPRGRGPDKPDHALEDELKPPRECSGAVKDTAIK